MHRSAPFVLCACVAAAQTAPTPPAAARSPAAALARATGDSLAGLSADHYKAGENSLRWTWRSARATLEFRDPALFAGRDAAGLGFWIYNERPADAELTAELTAGDKPAGAFRIRLNFTGWRPAYLAYKAAGVPAGVKPDGFRLVSPASPGSVWLDGLRFDHPNDTVRRSGTWANPSPESVVRLASAGDTPAYRPWPAHPNSVTPSESRDLALIASRLLPAEEKPRGGLKDDEANAVRKIFAEYRIRRSGGALTGRPVTGACPIAPEGGVPISEYLGFCDRVRNAYARSRTPAESAEFAGMFAALATHLIDQGWVPGGETRPGDNYPPRGLGAFAAMRGRLADAGIARDIGLSLAWFYGCQNEGNYLSEKPSASMDGLGFWYNELPRFLSLVPDESLRLRHMRAAVRAYDLSLVNNGTIAPDGACIHHGAFHFAYASYNLPRLLSTIRAFAGTDFFIDAKAHERLRTYARMIAFTVSAGEQPYNLNVRAGAPLRANMAGFAGVLADLGSPGNRGVGLDRDMAALALSQIVDQGPAGADTLKKQPYAGWLAAGIKPTDLTGFLAINAGPVAVHRRPGWLVTVAGQSNLTRGLEIYGWTEHNNYAQFARHGAICVVSGGNPPSQTASGWSPEGWNWSHFPGVTAPKLASRDLFQGYFMSANGNPYCGGAGLDGDGVWGMDCTVGNAVRFKKSVFCFDDRITVLTTDIASGFSEPTVTTLFQNSIRKDHTEVILRGGDKATLPSSRDIAGDGDTWLLDNQGVGYLLPGGRDTVRLSCSHQKWLWMATRHLIDPKKNPLTDPSGRKDLAYQRWSHTKKGRNLDEMESHYRPTEGDFALAYFDHGPKPAGASCLYTIVVRATPEKLDALTKTPPVKILSRDGGRHAVRDLASGAEAYSLFVSGDIPGEGLLRSVNMPVFAMFKPQPDKSLKIAVASTNVNRTEPVRIRMKGAWKTTAEAAVPVTAKPAEGGDTELEFSPDYYQAAEFRVVPAN